MVDLIKPDATFCGVRFCGDTAELGTGVAVRDGSGVMLTADVDGLDPTVAAVEPNQGG